MEAKVNFDEAAVCDRCGVFGAYLFDGEKFCADCYATRCSCCPEFGADDLSQKTAAGNNRAAEDPNVTNQPAPSTRRN